MAEHCPPFAQCPHDRPFFFGFEQTTNIRADLFLLCKKNIQQNLRRKRKPTTRLTRSLHRLLGVFIYKFFLDQMFTLIVIFHCEAKMMRNVFLGKAFFLNIFSESDKHTNTRTHTPKKDWHSSIPSRRRHFSSLFFFFSSQSSRISCTCL